MSSRTNIDPLSITDGKISNQAKISPRKIAPADEASLLIAQGDRKYQPKTIYGDGTIDADGKLTITSTPAPTTTIVEEELLPEDSVKIGPSSTDNTKKNSTKKVGSGAGAIPTRDSSGNLKAETADQATTATNADNATLLNGNNMEYYRNVANHNYGSSTNLTTDDGGIAGTSTPKLHKIITATNSGQSSPTEYTVEHDLGYQPQVTVLADTEDNGDYYEIDAEVKSETDKVTVKVSAQSLPLKIICS